MKLSSALFCTAALALPLGGAIAFHPASPIVAALAQTSNPLSSPPAQTQPPIDSPDRGPSDKGPRGKQGRGQEWLERLNLNAEQKTQIQTIRDQEKAASQELMQQMKAAQDKMRTLMANGSAEQLRQQHQQMQDLHQRLDDRRFETMLKIREILTPEQRTQLAELQPRRRGHQRGIGAPGA